MSGGFLPETTLTPSGTAETPIQSRHAERDSSPPPLRRLTPKQERRLMAYVDEQMVGIERDFNKRALSSAAMPTLDALIRRLEPLLELILQIPPIDPTSALRIAYLLRLTAGLALWITGYPLTGPSVEQDGPPRRHITASQEERDAAMEDLLDLLDELDRGWQAVLKGEAWYHGRGRSREGSWRAGTVDGDEVRQVILGKGPTLTERVRLRSAILGMRDRIIPWAEQYSTAHQPQTNRRNGLAESETETEDGTPSISAFGQVADSWEGRVIRLLNNTLQMLSDLGTF